MANFAALQPYPVPPVTTTDVAYWQAQFDLTDREVVQAIEAHRASDLPDDTTKRDWEREYDQAEAQGHNRETWEHWRYCMQGHRVNLRKPQIWPKVLVAIRSVLFDEVQIRRYTGANREFKYYTIVDGFGNRLTYVELYKHEYRSMLNNLDATCLWKRLRAIEIEPPGAPKDLWPHSAAPTLGIESTLPQYRFDDPNIEALPRQDEWPVVYFLYGSLARREQLQETLGLAQLPVLEPAMVWRGRLMKWGRYKALVNGSKDDKVQGFMYTIQDEEQEDALRRYETAKYEVVRCLMISLVDAREFVGLTFRFREEEKHLLRALEEPTESSADSSRPSSTDSSIDILSDSSTDSSSQESC